MNSRLKFDIGFEDDPDEGIGATEEESASWGWFRIVVDDVNLCQHVVNRGVSDRVHWYLITLLEWFVENWDALLHETKLPFPFAAAISARQGLRNFNPFRSVTGPYGETELEETAVFEWSERHSIRSSADGGIFPDVFLRRSRNKIEVSWGTTRVQGAPSDLRFLAPAGETLLESSETAQCLYKALSQAVGALCEKSPSSSRFHALKERLVALKESRGLERAAWMAGIGVSVSESEEFLRKLTQQVELKYRDLILPLPEELVISKAPAAVLMFGSLSPSVSEEDVQSILALLEEAVRPDGGKSGLPKIAHEDLDSRPWDQGYEFARLSREAIGVPRKPYKVGLEDLLTGADIRQKEVRLSDSKVRAIAICGEKLRPLIAVNMSCKHNHSEPGLRFTLAHELCHLLFDEEDGVPLAVASGQWAIASIEKRANAFAAMFLMPEDSCRDLFREYSQDGRPASYAVSEISATFGTGKSATLQHLKNLGFFDDAEASIIEEEFIN